MSKFQVGDDVDRYGKPCIVVVAQVDQCGCVVVVDKNGVYEVVHEGNLKLAPVTKQWLITTERRFAAHGDHYLGDDGGVNDWIGFVGAGSTVIGHEADVVVGVVRA